MGSENIKCAGKENLTAIIDWPFTGYPEEEDTPVVTDSRFSLQSPRIFQNLLSALCVPRALRVFVGSTSVLDPRLRWDWTESRTYGLPKDFMHSHTRDGQAKEVEIGDELLRLANAETLPEINGAGSANGRGSDRGERTDGSSQRVRRRDSGGNSTSQSDLSSNHTADLGTKETRMRMMWRTHS